MLILADGVIGTMMEPVVLPDMKSEEELAALKASKQGWACVGHKLDYAHRAWIQPGHWLTSDMQKANEDAAALYASWEKDVQVEEYRLEDAEVVLTAYGISALGKNRKSPAAPLPPERGGPSAGLSALPGGVRPGRLPAAGRRQRLLAPVPGHAGTGGGQRGGLCCFGAGPGPGRR